MAPSPAEITEDKFTFFRALHHLQEKKIGTLESELSKRDALLDQLRFHIQIYDANEKVYQAQLQAYEQQCQTHRLTADQLNRFMKQYTNSLLVQNHYQPAREGHSISQEKHQLAAVFQSTKEFPHHSPDYYVIITQKKFIFMQ